MNPRAVTHDPACTDDSDPQSLPFSAALAKVLAAAPR